MGPCKSCGSRIGEGLYCLTCERQLGIGAPAQEEKEMDRDGVHTGGIKPDNPMQLPPSMSSRLIPGFLSRLEETTEKRAADLCERWDRAFFAAIPMLAANEHQSNVVTCARDVANETIRRHAELMAGRDAAIAEVVG